MLHCRTVNPLALFLSHRNCNLSVVQLSNSVLLPNMHEALGLILSTTKKKEKNYNQDKIKQTSYVTQA